MALYLKSTFGKIDIVLAGAYEITFSKALAINPCSHFGKQEHLYQLASFLHDLLANGFSVCSKDAIKSDYCFLIMIDAPPPISLKELSSLRPLKTIMVLAEHPAYQRGNWKHIVRAMDLVVHSYDLDEQAIGCGQYVRVATSYVYKKIPSLFRDNLLGPEDRARDQQEVYASSIISSNIIRRSPSLYGFRRNLINSASIMFGERFAHYGKRWRLKKSPSFFDLKLKTKEFVYENCGLIPKVSLACYKGEVPSKNILFNCKTTFAIENHESPYGYNTEKAIEPLIYGCLPLYVSSPQSNWLSQFIDIYSRVDAINLLASASCWASHSLVDTSNASLQIRTEINKWLAIGPKTALSFLFSYIVDSLSA